MSLTPNQKKNIRENLKNVDSAEFAKQFKVNQEIVEVYINGISNKKSPKWFYLILIFIPIIFFILLEVGLRVSEYGINFSVFQPLSDEYPELIVFNPNYPKKYFNNTIAVPSVIPEPFSKIKASNSFRVFILGGSTTAGFPFSYNASFSRYIKRRIEILYPMVKIEFINMGISAVNSYTVRDLVPDIIKQKPDLVLIYAGHNEYYGALGVASTESIGNSRWLVNFSLSLKKLKTYQLVDNFVRSFKEVSSENEVGNSKTLMSQMIGEDLIEYKSELFHKGLSQFHENMEDVLNLLSEAEINTVISNLSSNLMQKPFESIVADKNSADGHFIRAEKYFLQGKYEKAKPEYILAKDKDALRFRAPKKINEIITKLSSKFEIPLVNIDSIFSSQSKGGITGYNLMVDHLHPNVEGHQILGDAFFNIIFRNSYLPKIKSKDISLEEQKKRAANSLSYTRFDSTYAKLILHKLLNTYPFVKNEKFGNKKYHLENFSDSLAEKVVQEKLSWEEGHLNAAKHFLILRKHRKFVDEMLTLIDDRPFIKWNYTFGVDKLKSVKKIDVALPILLKMNKRFPGYYSKKWLGTIAMERKLYPRAIYYYEGALKFKQAEAQTYFNISGAYFYTKQYNKSILALENCLGINPNYPNARRMLEKLAEEQ